MTNMKIDSWKSQLRKGAAELAVLSLLDHEACSGIGLLNQLKPYDHVGLSDGTLYPLLKRLERDGRIKGEWEQRDGGGRPIKTYSITDEGRVAARAMRDAWRDFKADISDIVEAKT
jgi:PadR family transcriptional regulator PadR